MDDIPYPIDERRKSSLYEDSFSELCGWLENLLCTGVIISLVTVTDKYKKIVQSRNEPITESNIRTTSVRDRLRTKFKNRILFTKLNNRQGVFISWNDLSAITESTLSDYLSSENNYNFQSNSVYNDRDNMNNEQMQAQALIQTIELLRDSMHENMHYLKQVEGDNESLAEFTPGLFWDCVPTLIKNFIGLLITNDLDFQSNKNNFEYSNLFNRDMYKLNPKSLKVSSIAYDIINARYDSYSTAKHLLLGNEIYHHVRSSHLLSILNRFGHTCSYNTIVSEKTTLNLIGYRKPVDIYCRNTFMSSRIIEQVSLMKRK